VGILQLLHSSCCFLNTNTVITWQLIQTARTLEAEWWHVCSEAWVQDQRKVSQVLGKFGLLDFTMLRPILTWRTFLNLWTVYFFNFANFFLAAANRGYWIHRYGGPPVYVQLKCVCDSGLWGQWYIYTHTHTHTQIIIFTYVTRMCKYDKH
jgi:hypothetical protein